MPIEIMGGTLPLTTQSAGPTVESEFSRRFDTDDGEVIQFNVGSNTVHSSEDGRLTLNESDADMFQTVLGDELPEIGGFQPFPEGLAGPATPNSAIGQSTSSGGGGFNADLGSDALNDEITDGVEVEAGGSGGGGGTSVVDSVGTGGGGGSMGGMVALGAAALVGYWLLA